MDFDTLSWPSSRYFKAPAHEDHLAQLHDALQLLLQVRPVDALPLLLRIHGLHGQEEVAQGLFHVGAEAQVPEGDVHEAAPGGVLLLQGQPQGHVAVARQGEEG